MKLFDIFRKVKTVPVTSLPPSSLPSICYAAAYFVLPHYAFKDCNKLVAMFIDTPASTGPFFYLMGCQFQEETPVDADAPRFRAHHGPLGGQYDYFVLEYPAPPAVDLSGIDLTQLPSEQLPVLAPHFSAIVRHRATKAVRYYVLGQAPVGGGTTFRSVSPEGINANHGPGP